jgi:hypothetical protein
VSSAIAANLEAAAAASSRAHPVIASTRAASSTPAKADTPGKSPSNMHSIIADVSTQSHRSTTKLWMKSALWITHTQYGTRARYCRIANPVTTQPTMVSTITTTQCRSS